LVKTESYLYSKLTICATPQLHTPDHQRWWWSGTVIVHWSLSMKLTYIGPG